MITISTKTVVRMFCFIAAAMLAMLGVVTTNAARTARYRRQLEYGYIQALQQAASSINALSSDLQKSAYAGTPAQLAEISAKVWKEAGTAKSALSGLPAGEANLESTCRFLSQVGDYAMYLSRKAGSGQEPDEEELETAKTLMEYARTLNERLSDIERIVSTGGADVNELFKARMGDDTGFTGFSDVEDGFEEYPVLIYDGPFSDHITERVPAATMGKPEIPRERARMTAAKWAGADPADLADGADEESNMPSYTFYNDDVEVGVTKNGGYVTYLVSSRAVGEKSLSTEQGKQSARAYLDGLGIGSMEATYCELSSGVLTINYAYNESGVICYTDLIKVGVAMDDGRVVFYDARGFVANHRERQWKDPVVAMEKARESVSKSLRIEDARLALIPTPGGNEALVWEFSCKGLYGENVLVYINADTGAEERILLLLESENGVLTV